MHPARRQEIGAAAIALGAFVAFGCGAGPSPLDGRWDAVVVVNEVEVPFRLDLTHNADAVAGSFFNGAEPLASSRGAFDGSVLTLEYDYFASRLEARLADGRLEGRYERARGAPYPFRAVRAAPLQAAAGDAPSIAGIWHIPTKSTKGEAAWRFVVHQSGAEVSAAILRVDGDTGALTGGFRDGRFVLSHFSGQRPALLEVTPEADGTLALVQNRRTRMTAVRAEEAQVRSVPAPADPARHSFARHAGEPFTFSFPDADGRVVAHDDPRFRNKVVIVSITGTWCPNCHDEAPFLTELYERYRGLGLEIVALSFEEAAQLENPARLRAYADRYRITYPMLLAGTPEQLNERVPQIENLNAFPTTIFLGRDGRVRAVHAGFPSPGSGTFFTEAKDEIRAIVEGLLTEGEGS